MDDREKKVKVLKALLAGRESVEDISEYTGLSKWVCEEILERLENVCIIKSEKVGGRKVFFVPEKERGKIKILIGE